jgi:threonine dehydratase
MPTVPDFSAIRGAHERIRPHVHRTPVLTCASLDAMAGGRLWFKCENFQKAGAFKSRGACNAVFSLPDAQAARGVVTSSSGNHGAALARAARLRGIPATVVMPQDSSAVKVAAIRGYGAAVRFCEPTMAARRAGVQQVIDETGAAVIPSYDDPRIIAGQGTAAVELLEDAGDLDALLVPVGGGGLLAGTLIAAKALRAGIRVSGCEPEVADDAYRSWRAGRIIPSDYPQTVADGLRTSLGELTFAVIREQVDEIVRVAEAQIVAAMRAVWERMKIVIEPSAAVPVAAVLAGSVAAAGRRIGIILSGGNVDLDRLPFRA